MYSIYFLKFLSHNHFKYCFYPVFSPPLGAPNKGVRFFHSILSASNTLLCFPFLFNLCFTVGSFPILSSSAFLAPQLSLTVKLTDWFLILFFEYLGCEFSIYFWFTQVQGFPQECSFRDPNPKQEGGLPGFSPSGTFGLQFLSHLPHTTHFLPPIPISKWLQGTSSLTIVSPLRLPVFHTLNTNNSSLSFSVLSF